MVDFKRPVPKKEVTEEKRVFSQPRRRGVKLSDDALSFVKIMVFGAAGTGKTHFVGQFVELGMKVGLISTDFGGSGHLTIKAHFNKIGRPELAENVYILPLEGWAEVTEFLRNPYKFDPALWEFDPDLLAWDGFSGFQQIDISEYVGDMTLAPKADGTEKIRSDYRESGLGGFENMDWGAIKVATTRSIEKFLTMKTPQGKSLHKVVTCLEAILYKPVDPNKPNAGTVLVDSYKPMLQGSGGVLTQAAFDLIMRTAAKVEKNDDGAVRKYILITEGSQNVAAKKRGFELDVVEPNDVKHIWEKIRKVLLQ